MVDAVRHPDFQTLDEEGIKRKLAGGVARRIAALKILEQVDSTNDCLMRGTGTAAGFCVCLAESQTAGKGRRGRGTWYSPKSGNLYLSVMRSGVAPPGSAWLALTAAAEVVSALAADRADGIGVKWPNDIYYRRGAGDGRGPGKLGGVLVESKGERCVVGLGLNVHLPSNVGPKTGVPWVALDGIRPGRLDRSGLASSMITAVVRAFDRVERDPVAVLRKHWEQYDLLMDREVVVLTGGKALAGVARGVDERGGLRVEHSGPGCDGPRVYYSAEVSVRW